MSSFGQRFLEEFRHRAPQARTIMIDNSLPAAALESSAGDLSACSAIVFATYTTNPELAGDLPLFLDKLTEGPAPVVLVSFGNPYLLAKHPKAAAFLDAFSTTSTSEAATARALFGEIPITGRMPVSIAGFAELGDGIQQVGETAAPDKTAAKTLR